MRLGSDRHKWNLWHYRFNRRMPHKPPILLRRMFLKSVVFFAIFPLFGTWDLTAQEGAVASMPDRNSGDYLIRRSAMSLLMRGPLEAQLRFRSEIEGRTMRGGGSYYQTGAGSQIRSRYELKLILDDQITSLTQIIDADESLWTIRSVGEQQLLTRTDLRRLRNELLPREELSTVAAVLPSTGLASASGGLAQLMTGLELQFEWGQPKLTEQSGVALLRLRGRWRPDALALLQPELKDRVKQADFDPAKELASHLPEFVDVDLGRDDGFPYRVAYVRSANGPTLVNSQSTMLLMEWHHVRLGAAQDPARFVFRPEGRDVSDITDQVLTRLAAKKE